jgi:hypothetical protein
MKHALALLLCSGCGGGVPIQLILDEFAIDLSLDDSLSSISTQLLPPDSPGLPEKWPDEFPDICWDALVTTDPDLGGRIDLTPDPEEDPEAAEQFGPVNNGLVDRIEIDRLVVRVESNTLNVPLPVIEVQAADDLMADGDDRRVWRTLGAVGGSALSPPCAAGMPAPAVVGPEELGDLDFVWARSGESYLNAQLADEVKELSLRARSRLVVDTAMFPARPRGELKLRLILVATFYVSAI